MKYLNTRVSLSIIAVLIPAVILSSCVPGLSSLALSRTATPARILVVAGADATATTTPFQPQAQTPTSDHPIFPTATLTVTPKPRLADASDLSPAFPPPAPIIPQPKDQINILLLGSDQRPYEGGFRTDALLLVTINQKTKGVSLTSFPRDLYVYIPGRGMDRINAAQVYGGFALTADTFEYNFGVRPDHYALINFNGFQALIDTLGGIDVQVAKTLTDERTGYGYYTINPGIVHMNGVTALWYVRARYTTNDFDRTRRQQEVIQGIFNRLLNFDLVSKVPSLYEQFKGTIRSDMSIDEMLRLIPVASEVAKGNNITRYAIGPAQVNSWIASDGAHVLLPIDSAIRTILRKALNAP